MFDYDWFFGGAYDEQQYCAKVRLALRKFPEVDPQTIDCNERIGSYMGDLEVRTLVYLRDGFSYEIKELVTSVRSRSHLTIECEPAEELYRVGAFVVSVPFDEIARVEVFAAHRDQKPENLPMITGFRNAPRRPTDAYDPDAGAGLPSKSSPA